MRFFNFLKSKLNTRRIIMICVGVLLLLGIGICAIVLISAKDDMVEQTLALRWSEEKDYAQNSIFFDPSLKLTDKDMEALRHSIEDGYKSKSTPASFSTAEKQGELFDTYSAFAPLTFTREKNSLTVDAIGVGGDFFLFHPVYLKNGNYFKEDDLMQDYILLDEETAWALFGSSDVVGMKVECSGKDFCVGGVYVREQGELETLAAGNAEPRVFISYEAMKELSLDTPVTCYELLGLNPIPHFSYSVLNDLHQFPEDQFILLENSTRFSYARYYDLLKNRKSREMRTDHIAYPYWENMARYKEGRLMYVAFAQWNMAALLFILIFVNALVFVIRHKPTRQGLESAMDVIRRKRQAKHMERLMKETEDEKAAEAEAAKAEEAAAKAQEEVKAAAAAAVQEEIAGEEAVKPAKGAEEVTYE